MSYNFFIAYQNRARERPGVKNAKNNSLPIPNNAPRKESVLERRVNALLKKYGYNSTEGKAILGEIEIFRLNMGICKELKDKRAEKKLITNFNKFLNDITKE